MKHAKNQHTVPCLYLREFGFERGAKHPQIYAFDKTNQSVHRTSIRNVAAELHFYEREDTGIEKGLQRFEDLFVGPYRRLLKVDKPSDLTQEEIAAVVGFITVQSMRTREMREMARSIDEQLSAVLRAEGVEDSAFGSISDDDMRQIQINALVRGGPNFAAHIARLKWVLTINGTTMPYWTSDNPITRYNPHPEVRQLRLAPIRGNGAFRLSTNIPAIGAVQTRNPGNGTFHPSPDFLAHGARANSRSWQGCVPANRFGRDCCAGTKKEHNARWWRVVAHSRDGKPSGPTCNWRLPPI